MRTYATILPWLRSKLSVGVYLLLTVPAYAVDTIDVVTPDPITEDWRWRTFDRSSGLVGAVREIYEDRSGNIWFGTDRGVQRYDGVRWRVYTTEDGLCHNAVRAVLEDRDGAFWFGTRGGISRLQISGENENWTTYTTDDGLPVDSIEWRGLSQTEDGTLWAGFQPPDSTASGGIATFQNESWTTLEVPVGHPRPRINGNILEASDGSIWFPTWKQGILRFDPTERNWRHYTTDDGLSGNGAIQITQTRDGSLWFAMWRSGINRFDGTTWTVYTMADGLPDRAYVGVFETREGRVWASDTSGELSLFDGKRWKTYDTLPQNRPGEARSTRDGALWLARWGGHEASRVDLSSRRWEVYTESPPGRIFHTNNHLWVLDREGATRYDGRRWIRYATADGLIDDPRTVVEATDGALWFSGAHNGRSAAARYDGGSWRTFSVGDGLAGQRIFTSHAASNGDVWFGTKWGTPAGEAAGVLRFDGESWTVYSTDDGLAHDMIYDIAETPDGRIWFATLDGVSWYDPASVNPWGSYADFWPDSLGRQKSVALQVTRRGNLWIGHGRDRRGVTMYDGEVFTRFLPEDGAPDFVWDIEETKDGTVWFLSRTSGLFSYDGSGWHVYDPPSIPIQVGGFSRLLSASPDGALWMKESLSGSLARLSVSRQEPETIVEAGPERVSSSGSLRLQWSGRDKWDATTPELVRYQWRMDDEPWSLWTNKTEHTFLEMASGDHSFQVRALNRDGIRDASPAIHAFVVEYPWWRNPWVLALAVFLLGGVGLQSNRVVRRDQRLREANATLQEQAARLEASNEALSSANNELFQVNVDLQREQVLERLRGQAQGMQSSEDIGTVVEAVYGELSGLGLRLWGTSIGIHLSETATEIWITDEDGSAVEPFVVESANVELREAQRRGDEYHHVRYEGEELKQMARQNLEKVRDHPLKAIPEEQWPEKMESYTAFFEGGRVTVAALEPIDEEYLILMKRFGEVFGYAHSRYKELQEKETQNRRLAVEAAVQRLRAEVQSMDEASDFERILSLLTESLKTVELTFDGCEIDVLDEPVENPTMEMFEANGFRYTTFRLDPDGNVASNSYTLAAPFPTVNERTIERFIAGEPWQGTSEGEAIVEVPAGSYGRLRLTATDRQNFDDDEVATLREFADAVALGYARYLDIREIQLNTERKSEFLASMSHELRTPMNAIKGFAGLLRRREPNLTDRGKENLEKVDQASDHLLGMINDLLDLSKIEAGRMDVNPERFDVGELVTSACDTVSPLIQEGVELRQDVADEIGEANTDKARLQQMVINLLSNAIKFTDSGSVSVSAATEDGQLIVSVFDTLPAEELPTIFDEYRQAEGSESSVQKGTGLGLSITKKFAELLGGTIGVDSEVGKGSTFTVRVPMTYQEPNS